MKGTTKNRVKAKRPVYRWIALGLVVASFLMLLLPWIHISMEIMGQKYSMPDLVDLACRNEGISSAQYRMELQTGITDSLSELAEDTGVQVNAKYAILTLNKVMRGNLSFLDAALICTYTGRVLKDVDQALRLNILSMSSADSKMLMTLDQAGNSVTIGAIVLWLVILAVVVTFIVAVFTLLAGKKGGAVAYTIAIAVAVVSSLICVAKINASLQGSGIELLEDLQNRFQATDLFHVSSVAGISLVCAVGSVLVMAVAGLWRKGSIVDPPTAMWRCSCGYQNKPEDLFCAECGQKRPERARCKCGAVLIPGTKFCGVCGRPVEESTPPTPPTTRHCARCGAALVPGARFCKECGIAIDTSSVPPVAPGKGLGDLWNQAGDQDLQ